MLNTEPGCQTGIIETSMSRTLSLTAWSCLLCVLHLYPYQQSSSCGPSKRKVRLLPVILGGDQREDLRCALSSRREFKIRRPMSPSTHSLHRVLPSDHSGTPGDTYRLTKGVYTQGTFKIGWVSSLFQPRCPGRAPITSFSETTDGSRCQSRTREVSHLRAMFYRSTNSRKTTAEDPD